MPFTEQLQSVVHEPFCEKAVKQHEIKNNMIRGLMGQCNKVAETNATLAMIYASGDIRTIRGLLINNVDVIEFEFLDNVIKNVEA